MYVWGGGLEIVKPLYSRHSKLVYFPNLLKPSSTHIQRENTTPRGSIVAEHVRGIARRQHSWSCGAEWDRQDDALMLWAMLRNLYLIPKAVANHPGIFRAGRSEIATVCQRHWVGVKAGSRETTWEAAAKI